MLAAAQHDRTNIIPAALSLTRWDIMHAANEAEIVEVVDAFENDASAAASALIREYIVMTADEQRVPVSALPHPVDDEVADLRSFYSPPGTVFVAKEAGTPIGCVALRAVSATTGEVRRMYVRADHRQRGVAAILMQRLHTHAAAHGLRTIVLDVLPERDAVIAWYRRLGYVDTDPFGESNQPMVYLRAEL